MENWLANYSPKKAPTWSKQLLSFLEYHSVNNVKKLRLWRSQTLAAITHKCCPITVKYIIFPAIFSRLFWNITCLDLECKQAHLSSISCRYSTMANCLNYAAYIPKHYCSLVGVSIRQNKLACRTPPEPRDTHIILFYLPIILFLYS